MSGNDQISKIATVVMSYFAGKKNAEKSKDLELAKKEIMENQKEIITRAELYHHNNNLKRKRLKESLYNKK